MVIPSLFMAGGGKSLDTRVGTYPKVSINPAVCVFGSLSGSGPLWWCLRWGWGEAVQLVLGGCLLLVAGNEESQRFLFFLITSKASKDSLKQSLTLCVCA